MLLDSGKKYLISNIYTTNKAGLNHQLYLFNILNRYIFFNLFF